MLGHHQMTTEALISEFCNHALMRPVETSCLTRSNDAVKYLEDTCPCSFNKFTCTIFSTNGKLLIIVLVQLCSSSVMGKQNW